MAIQYGSLSENNPNSKCFNCDSEFYCGVRDESKRCWCYNLPRTPFSIEDRRCMCISCLERKIKESEHDVCP